MTVDGAATGSGSSGRVDRWLNSDLVGIPATLYTFGVLVVSFLVFRYAAPIAGVIVAVGLWVPMVVFAIRGRGYPTAPLDIGGQATGPRHRLLVIANQGLEDPALFEAVHRRTDRTDTEAMILAPVVASSRLRDLSNDVDRELELAERRVDSALERLVRDGVSATGRVDIAEPMESLLDGLREFPPNEVLMLPGREAGWGAAGVLAERVRAEAGLPVTELGSEQLPQPA
jgi:hypothetical protein